MNVYLKFDVEKFKWDVVDENKYDSTYEMLRDSVNGSIERVTWIPQFENKGIDVWLNDVGKLIELEPSVAVFKDSNLIELFCGNIIFSRHNGFETVPLMSEDLEYIIKQFGFGITNKGKPILVLRI